MISEMGVGRILDLRGTGTPTIDEVKPLLVTQVHSLGVSLDPLLHLDLQVARSTFHQFYLVRRLQHFLSDSDLFIIIQTFITLRTDYCSAP